MGRLTDILASDDADSLRNAWSSTPSAPEMAPLPDGEYVTRIVAGELAASRTNATPSYRLTFSVLEGAHVGRKVWQDLWLTAAALPMTKRDLAKLGITDLEQLETPLPPGIRCQVKIVVHRDDNGSEFNRVKKFKVLGIDSPTPDPFAPPSAPLSPTSAETGGTTLNVEGQSDA